MKVFVFSNDIDSLKIVKKISEIDVHFCTKAMSTCAKEQILLQIDEQTSILESINYLAKELSSCQKALFITSSYFKDIAALLAGYLNAGVVCDVVEFSLEDKVKTKNLAYGGALVKESQIESDLAFISLSPNYIFDDYELALNDIEAKNIQITKNKIHINEQRKKQSSDVDLTKAKLILAVGRGFAQKQDLDLAYQYANKINAQIACSRPIAETEKWIDKSRYVGISGNITRADVYIAVGISGQVQHMVGCKDAKKIVVINKDEKAPIFEQADLAIVGDLKEVLAQLIQ